jgi:hypothetical protein
MNRLPGGCLSGCLRAQKVAYSPCAESHRHFRQHSMKTRVNSGDTRLPILATVPTLGNHVLPAGCLEGCQ